MSTITKITINAIISSFMPYLLRPVEVCAGSVHIGHRFSLANGFFDHENSDLVWAETLVPEMKYVIAVSCWLMSLIDDHLRGDPAGHGITRRVKLDEN